MLISKKELLIETGISYGQLYRWKRERLIPDEWFVKQAVFTGQETFFPRERILSRIRAIQELKDKYSLEELARMLSPEVAERYFTRQDLKLIAEIPDEFIERFSAGFGKEVFTYIEVLVMVAVCRFAGAEPEEARLELVTIRGLKDVCAKLHSTEYILEIFKFKGNYLGLMYPENAGVLADGRLESAAQFRMDEIAGQFKLKYRHRFNFSFSDDSVDEGEGGDRHE